MPGACCGGVENCFNALDEQDCTIRSGAVGNYHEGFDCDVVDCVTGLVLGACCLPDDGGCVVTHRFSQDITNPGCLERDGEFQGEGTTCDIPPDGIGICAPPPPLEGCIKPRPDRSAGRGWSANLCQNAVFLPHTAVVDLFTVYIFPNPGVVTARVTALPFGFDLDTTTATQQITTRIPYNRPGAVPVVTVGDLVALINGEFGWQAEVLPGARDFPVAAIDLGGRSNVLGEENKATMSGLNDADGDGGAGNLGAATPHAIRALPGRLELDPCAHHRGDLVIDDDGFASIAFCSQPTSGDETSRQWSLAGLYVVESDPNGFVAPGDAYFAGAYHAPFFTEAHFRSHKVRCDFLR